MIQNKLIGSVTRMTQVAFFSLTVCVLLISNALAAATGVELSALISESPKKITLSWENMSTTPASEYKLYRKLKNSATWPAPIATLAGNINAYDDTSITVGTAYEYKVEKYVDNALKAEDYVAAGIKIAEVPNRGGVLILVHSDVMQSLPQELTRLKYDLLGDGWQVLEREVTPQMTVPQVKAMIKDVYKVKANNLKSLLLLGKIPVPYAGKNPPDGHPEQAGAQPSDGYYADMDGNWTDLEDMTYQDQGASLGRKTPLQSLGALQIQSRHFNIPGDGKFDQFVMSNAYELSYGRVDLSDLGAFLPMTETDLLKQYLNKNHRYRQAKMEIPTKGYIWNNFQCVGNFLGGITARAKEDFDKLLGKANVEDTCNYSRPNQRTDKFIWSRISSWGFSHGLHLWQDSLPNSEQSFAVTGSNAIFYQIFGSYASDFGRDNAFIKAPLATPDYGLTSIWSGFADIRYHRMAVGETVGESTQYSQNNLNNVLGSWLQLLGDPTLRMYPVVPPQSLQVERINNTRLRLTWSGSSDVDLVGYKVYQSDAFDKAAVLKSSPGKDSRSVTITISKVGNYYFSVRAKKLTRTPTGSFYNLSQGATLGVKIDSMSNTQVSILDADHHLVVPVQATGRRFANSDAITIYPIKEGSISVEQGGYLMMTQRYGSHGPSHYDLKPFGYIVKDGVVVATFPGQLLDHPTSFWAEGMIENKFGFRLPLLDVGEYKLYAGLVNEHVHNTDPDKIWPLRTATGVQEGTGALRGSYEIGTLRIIPDASAPRIIVFTNNQRVPVDHPVPLVGNVFDPSGVRSIEVFINNVSQGLEAMSSRVERMSFNKSLVFNQLGKNNIVKIRVYDMLGHMSEKNMEFDAYLDPQRSKPDITVESVTFNPAVPVIRQPLSITITEKNTGRKAAGPHKTSFRLHCGHAIYDRILLDMPEIPAEQSRSVTFNFSTDWCTGVNNYWVIADFIEGDQHRGSAPRGVIEEANKANNVRQGDVTILASEVRISRAQLINGGDGTTPVPNEARLMQGEVVKFVWESNAETCESEGFTDAWGRKQFPASGSHTFVMDFGTKSSADLKMTCSKAGVSDTASFKINKRDVASSIRIFLDGLDGNPTTLTPGQTYSVKYTATDHSGLSMNFVLMSSKGTAGVISNTIPRNAEGTVPFTVSTRMDPGAYWIMGYVVKGYGSQHFPVIRSANFQIAPMINPDDMVTVLSPSGINVSFTQGAAMTIQWRVHPSLVGKKVDIKLIGVDGSVRAISTQRTLSSENGSLSWTIPQSVSTPRFGAGYRVQMIVKVGTNTLTDESNEVFYIRPSGGKITNLSPASPSVIARGGILSITGSGFPVGTPVNVICKPTSIQRASLVCGEATSTNGTTMSVSLPSNIPGGEYWIELRKRPGDRDPFFGPISTKKIRVRD